MLKIVPVLTALLSSSLVHAQSALAPAQSPNAGGPTSEAEPKPANPPSDEVAAAPAPAPVAAAPALTPQATAEARSSAVQQPPGGEVAREGFAGFAVRSADDRYRVRLGGFVQADARLFAQSAGEPKHTFAVRRARLELRATLAKYFELRIQPELAESKLTLLDAFGNLRFIDQLQLQVGKMKSPVGLEYLRSPTALAFPEFGLPSLLVPQRDVGVVVHGALLKGTVAYQLGIFNGVADGTNGDLDENAEKDWEGRVFVHPLRPLALPLLDGLGVGIAGTHGEQAGALPTFRTPGREAFFGYVETARAQGPRTRLAPQAYWYFGPVGALVEYVRTEQAVANDAPTSDVVSQAWQVVGSVVLGGKAGYQGVTVAAPLDPFAGTWGALELAARYGRLSVDDVAFERGLADPLVSARRARSLGVAASWWFIDGTRVHLSYDRTTFEGGAGAGDRETEGVVVGRLQVAL